MGDALTLVDGYMRHPKADVRQAAVQAYAGVANVQNVAAIENLGEALEDLHRNVRQAAADGLFRLAGVGDQNLRQVIRARVDHPQASVRQTASELLESIE